MGERKSIVLRAGILKYIIVIERIIMILKLISNRN